MLHNINVTYTTKKLLTLRHSNRVFKIWRCIHLDFIWKYLSIQRWFLNKRSSSIIKIKCKLITKRLWLNFASWWMNEYTERILFLTLIWSFHWILQKWNLIESVCRTFFSLHSKQMLRQHDLVCISILELVHTLSVYVSLPVLITRINYWIQIFANLIFCDCLFSIFVALNLKQNVLQFVVKCRITVSLSRWKAIVLEFQKKKILKWFDIW